PHLLPSSLFGCVCVCVCVCRYPASFSLFTQVSWDQAHRLSWSGTDRSVLFFFARFFLFLVEETPLRTCKLHTERPREIAHLSTEGLGRICPPEPTAPHAGIEPMTFLL